MPLLLCVSQGKVHNPTGEGVRPISAQVQAKATKVAEWTTTQQNGEVAHASHTAANLHETKVKEGTAKRNITRKKTADKDTGNFNSVFKKQGGHGKAQWQDAMDPSYVQEIPIDEKDPIYDEAQDLQRYILTSGATVPVTEKRGYDPNTSKAVYGPLWTLQEFKAQLLECLKEYFDSCDAEEVIRTISELGCPEYHPEIVKKAISLAMDKGPRERELTSRLFTVFPMSMEELQAGFIILLDGMDDLSKDVPDAKVCCF